MRTAWQTRRLGDLASAVSTGPFGSILHKSDYVRDGVPLVNPINIVGERIVPDPGKLINNITKRLLSSYVLAEGDVVVGRRGEIGRCAVVGPSENGWICGTGSFFIRPLPSLDSQFLAHLIRSSDYREKLEELSTGATMKNLSNKALGNLAISVPPLSEQQRIVGILDESFGGIATAKANAEKNLQNARAIFEGHLESIFTQRSEGWLSKPFEDCIEDVKYTQKIQRKDFLDSGLHPIISQEADFINGYWGNESDVLRVVRPVVIFGDHTRVLKFVDFDFVLGADGVKILLPKSFLVPKYFFYALRSVHLKSLGYSRHYRLLKELEIGYPSPAEQAAVADRLDKLEVETRRLEAIYQRKLAALDELKKSLLHQAFTGQL